MTTSRAKVIGHLITIIATVALAVAAGCVPR
jgi:hypothetical protein